MLDPTQFRLGVIRPVLEALAPEIPYSRAAECLLIGTAAQESRLKYLRQLNGGPALGLYQVEPKTFAWLWDDWLSRRPALKEKFRAFVGDWRVVLPEEELVGNLYFSTAICRLRYWVAPERLPDADDVRGLAGYWKRHYNTSLGAGTVDQFIESYGLTFERRAKATLSNF